VVSNWSDGIEPYAFRFSVSPMTEPYRMHFYTERRIYRPGQTVYFKGVIRADDDGHYTSPRPGTPVEVYVTDAQGREAWRGKLSVNDMGTVDGEFPLSETAALGYYRLQTNFGVAEERGYSPYGTDFQVAEYRKPQFQVGVTTDQPEYYHGDTIRAKAEATYFFGGPVAQANVTWRVMGRDYTFDRWQGPGYYSFADDTDDNKPYYGEGERLITEGRGRTDALGRFSFGLPADIAERKRSQVYAIEVSVVDVDNQEVSARAAAIIHKGDFYIGLTAPEYVGVAGKEMAVRSITVDTQGVTVTHKALEIVFYEHEWYSVRERAEDGNYYWANKVRDTAVATRTVTTDGRGVAATSFVPPEGGLYKAVASGRDARENTVRSALYLWVSGAGYINWGQRNDDRIELVADKKEYRPGDVAKVLVPSPYQKPVAALVTIERGHVYEHRLITLASNSEQLDIAILPEYAPNIFVSVVMVQGSADGDGKADIKMGYVNLPVSTERQELQVSVTPDRAGPYKPREQATFDVAVRDYRGRGVAAEVSLQLVDLAVETLVGGPGPDMLETFYRERGLSVLTASALSLAVNRLALPVTGGDKGGGGGAEAEGMVRQVFPDTAFWSPAVRTDAAGNARVTVTLPDNLTTWRMTAQAVTAETQVGRARADVVSTLQVMIRPITPRFFTIGDRPILGAAVHNNTAQDLDLVASLATEGVAVTGGSQTVRVAAGARRVVQWPALVQAADEATLSFRVQGGGLSDAVLWRLPIYHLSYPETVGTAGIVEDSILELVRVPAGVDATQGELTVILEPSLAAGMTEGLVFLQTYPYDCIEQTMSRFLPSVALYDAMRGAGLRRLDWEARLPEQVAVGLQRIYALQNLDGGWSWWSNGTSSPELTAYVLVGLSLAKGADFNVSA
ncbi:MAG: MG2 domain-containing protein, partial [Chloroflexota bacterium]